MLSGIVVSAKRDQVLVAVFLGIGLFSTIARIFVRYRNSRLWWDDGVAFLTALFLVLMDVGNLLTDTILTPLSHEAHNDLGILQYWTVLISYSLVVWSARISLLLSIIRLIPSIFTLRRVSEIASIVFFCMCMAMLASRVYICASDKSWYNAPKPLCQVGTYTSIAISELMTDIIGDISLVAIPIRLLYQVSLPSSKRRMLIIMFGISLLTSTISILRAVVMIGSSRGLLVIFSVVEVGTALVAANLAVLIPYIHRLLNPEGDFDSKPYTYYRSFSANGAMRMRRVSNLATDVALSHITTDSGRFSTSVRRPERCFDPESKSSNTVGLYMESSNAQQLGQQSLSPSDSGASPTVVTVTVAHSEDPKSQFDLYCF